MSGVLRLGNTGAATGRSTIQATATSDATFSLPSAGGTILTTDFDTIGNITWNGSNINITNADLNVDNGTLFVDESTNRVGIGTASPSYKLHVTDTGAFTKNRSNTGGIVNCALAIDPADSTMFFGFRVNQAANDLVLDSNSASDVITFGPTGTANFGGFDLSLTNNSGVEVRHTGEVLIQRPSNEGTSAVFDVRLGNTQKVNILANGTATFKNVVDATSATYTFIGRRDTDSTATFAVTDAGYANLGPISGNISNIILDGSNGTARLISNVGIGSTGSVAITPQKKLHVRDDSDSYPLLVQNRTNAVSTCGVALIATGSDFSDGQYATIEALSGGTGSTQHELRFRTCTSGGSPSERIRILANGGLTFNGDTAQANALDYYEEGSWTPQSGLNFGAFSNAFGKYIKIGQFVHLTFQFNYASGSAVNAGQVLNLPFMVRADNPGSGIQSTNVCYATVGGNTLMYLNWAEESKQEMYITLPNPLHGTATAAAGFVRGSLAYISNA